MRPYALPRWPAGNPRFATVRRRAAFFIPAIVLLLGTACTTIDTAQGVPASLDRGEIAGGHTAGQTFVAQHDGLVAIEVMLASLDRQNSGTLTLRLRDQPESPGDLRMASIDAAQVTGNVYHRFAFAPLPDSAGRRYYFSLESPGTAAGSGAAAWQGAGDRYVDGSLYLDGVPAEGQLTFRLVYDPVQVATGFGVSALASVPAALAVAALLLLPGLALWVWLGDRNGANQAHDWRTAVLLSPAVTIALIPVLLLGARLAGLRLGEPAPWVLIGLGGLGLATGIRHRRTRLRRPALDWSDLALLVVATLTVAVRLLVVRTQAAPFWDDGHEHATIVQLLLDQGGLFSSWEPYAPFNTFTTQYGFHGLAAFIQWLSGWTMPRAVVVTGQVVNALAALCLYPLAVRLSGSRWAGVFAVLAAGLLSPMPMEYVNWGRYPQLAGQAVLPAALWFLMALFPVPHVPARDAPEPGVHRAKDGDTARSQAPRGFAAGGAVLAGLTATGMLLNSYRMVHFYALFAIIWTLGSLMLARKPRRERLIAAGRVGLAALVAGLLLLPWQLGVGAGELVGVLQNTLAGVVPQEAVWRNVLAEYDYLNAVPLYGPQWLFTLAVAGLVWAAVRGRWGLVTIGLWTGALLLIPLLRLIRFPTAAFFQVFALVIALYIPIALLVGWLAAEVFRLVAADQPRAAIPLALAVVAVGALWGFGQRATVIDRSWSLLTPGDEVAAGWIRANVPGDAVFAVNSRLYHGDMAVIGTDAGIWLPLLAGRDTLVPPLYAFTNEAETRPGYRRELLDLTRTLLAAPLPSPEGLNALCRLGVTHLYIGQRHGAAGQDADTVVFNAEALAASPDFTALYRVDRVWVFALAPGACAGGREARAAAGIAGYGETPVP